MRALLLLPAFALSALGWCGITLTFSSPGAHAVWTAPDLSTPPDEAIDVQERTYEYEGVLNEYLLVLDKATGDIAYRKTREVGASWDVKASDYKMVAEVQVRVEFEGKGIESASVRMNGTTPRGIGPGSDGTVTFRNVRVGDASVEVSFENDRGRPRVRTQKFPISIERDQKVPKLVFSLTDRVKTVEPPKVEDPKPAAPAKTTTPGAPSKAGGSVVGNILVFLLVLAGLVGLLWVALRWISQNQDKARDAMTKVGVPLDPLPDDPVSTPSIADPPPAPPSAAPAPPQKIVLDARPPPVAPVVSSPLAAPGETRLVGPGGMSFALTEGSNVVGREDGLAVSLVGESTISRRHAEIVRQGSSVTLTDLGSTNGTFVNGRRIDAPTAIHPGDQVQFGAVSMRLE